MMKMERIEGTSAVSLKVFLPSNTSWQGLSRTISNCNSLRIRTDKRTMATLQLAKHAREMGLARDPAMLYKRIVKEIPRILTIYDIDMPIEQAKASVRKHFYDNGAIKDYRIQEALVAQGYFALETTMLQHKQKAHLMHFLEGYTIPNEADRKRLYEDATIDEQFARN